MTLREEKLNTLFKKLIAKFLHSELERGILVSVNNFIISKDLKNAVAFITIYPHTFRSVVPTKSEQSKHNGIKDVTVYPKNEEEIVLKEINAKKKELRDFFKEHTQIKTLPYVQFKIDLVEKNR